MRKRKSLEQKVKDGFKKLGMEIETEASQDLAAYKKGKPLRVQDLKALPDDAVDGAYRITRDPEYGTLYVRLSDGSSFGADFTGDSDLTDEQSCVEDKGEGEMRLYQAVLRG